MTDDDDAVAAVRDETASNAQALTSRAQRTPTLPPIEIGTLRLEGQATDDAEHPLGGVTVTLGGGARVVTTEADGSFAFDDLAEGTYALTAERDDWYGEELEARLDATSDPVTIQMKRGPTILVHVTDTIGAPIANAHVEAYPRAATTGKDGTAQLRGVDMGSERVTASAPGYEEAHVSVPTGDDPSGMVEVTVVLGTGAALSGVVVDADGKLVADALVEVEEAGDKRREGVTVDEHGAWTLPNLGAGKYVARAHSSNYVTPADVPFELDGVHRKSGLVLHLENGASVFGLVVDAAGQPVAEASVQVGSKNVDTDAHGKFEALGLDPDVYDVSASTKTASSPSQTVKVARTTRVEVRLAVVASSIAGVVVDSRGVPVESAHVRGQSKDPHGAASDRTDEHGHFDFGGVPPGDYEVTAEREDQNGPGTMTPVHIASGNRAVRIVIADLAAITGRVVLDGQPVAYYGVTLTDNPEGRSYSSPTAVRDPHGTFTQRGIAPGTWTVVIVGPGFARKTIASVGVADGATVDLGDIQVERGDSIRGHVTDARGTPVAGALVHVAAGHGSLDDERLRGLMRDDFTTTTDVSGAYELDGMTDTDNARRIVATHGGESSADRTLAPGETDVDLVLDATGALDGTITNNVNEVYFVWATPSANRDVTYDADLDSTGSFHFERLPPGEYEVRVGGHRSAPAVNVTVVAGARATVAFELPRDPVKLIVRAPGCSTVTLRQSGSEAMFGLELCSHDQATFDAIAPGMYDVCSDASTCMAVVVPAQAEMTVDLQP